MSARTAGSRHRSRSSRGRARASLEVEHGHSNTGARLEAEAAELLTHRLDAAAEIVRPDGEPGRERLEAEEAERAAAAAHLALGRARREARGVDAEPVAVPRARALGGAAPRGDAAVDRRRRAESVAPTLVALDLAGGQEARERTRTLFSAIPNSSPPRPTPTGMVRPQGREQVEDQALGGRATARTLQSLRILQFE
jgi:hypothetical protein